MKKIPMALFASLAMSAANAANHDDNEKLAQLANLAGHGCRFLNVPCFPKPVWQPCGIIMNFTCLRKMVN